MAKEASKNPLEVLASAPRAPLRITSKFRDRKSVRSHRAEPEDPPQVPRREKSHYKTKLPLAQPRPVGAVARVHVIARLRDRFFIKPVRLV